MGVELLDSLLENYKLYLTQKEANPLNLLNKQIQNTGLSETELSLILGGILGDGSLKLHSGYKNARYSFRHSVVQKAYFDWKAEKLRGICAKKSVYLQKPDGYSKNEKLRFCSGARTELTKLLEITHNGNQIAIKRSWLNHLTPLSLAIWWCDDGSLMAGKKGCLCTDSFPLEAQELIVTYFEKTWDVSFKRYEVASGANKHNPLANKTYHRLYLMQNSLKKFLTIIMPYIPCREMVYKCAVEYKDQQFQERWISHMEEMLPLELKSVAREHYEERAKFSEKVVSESQASFDDDVIIFKDINGNVFEKFLSEDES